MNDIDIPEILPSVEPTNKPPANAPKPNSFANLFAKSKAAEEKKKAQEAARGVMHGSGLTQKVIKQQETTFLRADEALKIAEAHQTTIPGAASVIPIFKPSDAQRTKLGEITLDESQQIALEGLRQQKVACLIGAAGTGKTTLTKRFIEELEDQFATIRNPYAKSNTYTEDDDNEYPAIAFAAFTGRAVQQLKKALPRQYHTMCATIHATLGYAPVGESYYDKEAGIYKERMIFRPTFTASNKLPFQTIVLDEAGMIPIPLWNELIDALLPTCRIYLIGDINQLPPVQGRSVLGFAMINWPTYTLEKIHRQSADNPIIANAHRILEGKMPLAVPGKFDMLFYNEGSSKFGHVGMAAVQKLTRTGSFDPLRDAFIVATNTGALGQEYLNERLVHFFNPPRPDNKPLPTDKLDDPMWQLKFMQIGQRHMIRTGVRTVSYAVGDKIMLLQNDRQRGLTNGMTGIVMEINRNGAFRDVIGEFGGSDDEQHEIDLDEDALTAAHGRVLEAEANGEEKEDVNERQASHIMRVGFFIPGTKDIYMEVDFSTAGHYNKLRLAYAFTCHKSQGGEYPTVIVLVHSAASVLLCREWLYTAVTRASNRIIIIANERGMKTAINTQRVKGNTIEQKKRSYFAWQEENASRSDKSVPVLWTPTKVGV